MILKILSNQRLNRDVFKMALDCPLPSAPHPGQFVEVALNGKYLRRPFGIADYHCGVLTLLYRVVGEGTKAMSGYSPDRELDVLLPLGVGFDLSGVKAPLVIGGGLGCAPLLYLVRRLADEGVRAKAVLGFKSQSDVVCESEFMQFCDLTVCTDDGSYGENGNAAEVIQAKNIVFDRYYACGPMPLLKAVQAQSVLGQLSLEARMGCGFGACMGCSIPTVDGVKRICKDGPVFDAKSVTL